MLVVLILESTVHAEISLALRPAFAYIDECTLYLDVVSTVDVVNIVDVVSIAPMSRLKTGTIPE